MPSQTDDSKQPRALPREDLNPLLNPLLSQNMGRWAEVYFTNLPENREQAVLDLLRDLEAEAGLRHGSSDAQAALVEGSSASSIRDNSALLRCRQCGYENRADYNFCGACRAELTPQAGSEFQGEAHLEARSEERELAGPTSRRNGETWENLEILGTATESEPEKFHTSPDAAAHHNFEHHEEHRKWKLSEPGGIRGDNRNDDHGNDVYMFRSVDRPRALRPYHFFVGGVLALVLLFFLYRTQWGKPAVLGSPAATPVPSAATPGSATAPAVPATPKFEITNDNAPSNTKSGAASKVASNPTSTKAPGAPLSSSSPETPSPETDAIARPVSGNAAHNALAGTPTPADVNSRPSSANGEAELALAKDLLSGGNGKERDSVQAAELLWKAVSKRNAEASDLLSDLYLKGDGVQKNCDQARVLLDAAASKGNRDAADRLRHLQAFGCE